MPSSLPTPSVTEHSHSQPPSPDLHDNQRQLISSDSGQPVQESDDEYTASQCLPLAQGRVSACDGKVTLSGLLHGIVFFPFLFFY